MRRKLFQHQIDFVKDVTTPELALIGGYGSGKTVAAAVKAIVLAGLNPGCEGIIVSPTYSMSEKVFIPTLRKELENAGIRFNGDGPNNYRYNKSSKLITLTIGGNKSLIHILSGENVSTHGAGLNAAWFGLDEADLLSLNDFGEAWDMLSSRLRDPKAKYKQAFAVSTPEGYKGCYKNWVSDIIDNPELAKTRKRIKAKTKSNWHLPPDYITRLEARYPAHLLKAYMEGEFVNLEGTPVYWKFDPDLNSTDLTVKAFPQNVLHVGVDFNKGINAAVVHVVKNNQAFAVEEIYGSRHVQALADTIKHKYPFQFANNAIRFYPDASCYEGIQNLIRNFNEFAQNGEPNLRLSKGNPPVSKRIGAVNEKFKVTGGGPESFVNKATCPELYKGLVQQAYNDKGEPDKKSGIDHSLDAHGYFIHRTWPLAGTVSARIS